MEKRYEEILDKEEFDAQMREQKQKRQERIIYFACVGFAIFTCLAFAFLLIAFLFLGICQVFSAKFSFIGLVQWLEGLPYVWIDQPQLLKTQFIIGCIFLIFFLIITVLLIISTVSIIRDMLRLSDISVNELDPKQLTSSIFNACISCFTFVFAFIALTSPSTSLPLPDVTVVLFVLFGLLIVAEVIIKNIYIFYNFQKSTFNKKNFALSLTRSFLLLTLVSLLFALTYGGYIQSFLGQIYAYQPTDTFALISLIVTFLQYIITFRCVTLFNNTVRNSGLNMFEKAYDFYGKISYAPISSFKLYLDKAGKQTTRLIILSVVCFILQLLPYVLVDGSFVFPANGVELIFKFGGYYAFIISTAVAVKIACKIPVRYKHRLSSK